MLTSTWIQISRLHVCFFYFTDVDDEYEDEEDQWEDGADILEKGEAAGVVL